jgi:hypothetical protein
MVLYPRATSPIDFSTHALEVLTWEGNDCPYSNSYVFSREAVGTIFYVFSMTRPGREPDTSSTEYGNGVTEPYPWVTTNIIFMTTKIVHFKFSKAFNLFTYCTLREGWHMSKTKHLTVLWSCTQGQPAQFTSQPMSLRF